MSKIPPLNLPEEYKHAIVNGIFSAITQDIPSIIAENELPTDNGSGCFDGISLTRICQRICPAVFKSSIQNVAHFVLY